MLVQYYYPFSLSPNRLDKYLASGWFRNSIMLFRSKMLCMDGNLFDVVNIRLSLNGYKFPKRYDKLIRKNLDNFHVSINKACITKKKEKLYQQHKLRFKGFVYENLKQFLYSDTFSSVFETYEIEVYDGERLVAFSYFDKGNHSIASLLGVYDEEYSKYSLGVFTMLLEIDFGLNNGTKYYYPGYIFNQPSIFDYKLKLGNYDYYDWNGRWKPLRFPIQYPSYSSDLYNKISYFKEKLEVENVESQLQIYPYFPLGYMEKTIDSFVKGPFLIFLTHSGLNNKQKSLVVEYLPEKNEYFLSIIKSCPEYNQILNKQLNNENKRSEIQNYVLKYVNTIFSTPSIDEMLSHIKQR